MRAPLHCIIRAWVDPGSRQAWQISAWAASALVVCRRGRRYEKGQQLALCRIALPEEGTVVSTLEVRNLHQSTLRSGELVLRAGCHFVGIPAAHQAMIQRYIIRIDRERRAWERGS